MKITHILWGLTLGGIESMVVNIVNHQSISHKVELIVVNDGTKDNSIEKTLVSSYNYTSIERLTSFFFPFHPHIS